MIEQYPDKLVREDGSQLSCRFYPNNRSAGLKKIKDGTEVDVKFTIALPFYSPTLLVDEVVTGYDQNGEAIVWQDSIAIFHRGQLHCVAYV
ncbi:hypothetical protein [Sphingobacterium spiritivorum]|uniref:hypothetical protein n=1 Tax=Sphingobacterium spiritivorum TaxID=258 RepID=UPI001917E73C|nr:hypothetical protein [Sphingobacterium spiritivorum]QQT26824.1 hypothetical protein I6J02_02870 [Sphingobacterium spiritivorum]